MSLESSLAKAIVRLIHEQHGEKVAAGWMLSSCEICGRQRPCEAEEYTGYTRWLWNRTERHWVFLQCDFCGKKFKLIPRGPVLLERNWTSRGETASQFASRTQPKGLVNSGTETDAVLLSALKQAGKSKDRWKGTIHVSWIGAGVGLVLGVGASFAIHFAGLDKLWQFEDESGSPLHFFVPIGFVIAGMLMGAKDVGPTIQREKLESLIKRYDLDTTRLLELARQHRLPGAEKVIRELRQLQ